MDSIDQYLIDFRDAFGERGLSPVVGSVLMVAVVVILAAVVAFFVLGLEGPQNHTGDVTFVENAEERTVDVYVSEPGNADRFEILGEGITCEEDEKDQPVLSGSGDTCTIQNPPESIYVISILNTGDEQVVQTYEPGDVTLTGEDSDSTDYDYAPTTCDLDEETAGDGTASSPHELENTHHLQCVREHRHEHHKLANDIDAYGTADWNDGSGFVPIGDTPADSDDPDDEDYPSFTGSLDGDGHSINGLTIEPDTDSDEPVGLFGHSEGDVSNLTLDTVTVTGYDGVGGLVGNNEGSISLVTINGTSMIDGDARVGGLVGENNGDISDIDTEDNTTVVSTGDYVGGITGFNFGSLENISVSGDGSVEGEDHIGGIVGASHQRVTNAQFDTYVSGNKYVGGISGSNKHRYDDFDGTVIESTIEYSRVTGTVEGYQYVGGLSGQSGAHDDTEWGPGGVHSSVSSATVYGHVQVGGMVGYAQHGDITNSEVTDIHVEFIEGDQTTPRAVGGVLGANRAANIENMDEVSGTVIAGDDMYNGAGGVVGRMAGGYQHSLEITSITVSIDVDATNTSHVGGVVGHVRPDSGDDGDLTITDATFTGTVETIGGQNLGSIVGHAQHDVMLDGIVVTGSDGPIIDTTDAERTGGLVGFLRDGSSINNASLDGEVRTVSQSDNSSATIGGLVGAMSGGVSITESHADVYVNADDGEWVANVGGLVGAIGDNDVHNSSVTGTVHGNNANVGGVAGLANSNGEITNTWSGANVKGWNDIGGLVGSSSATIEDSFAYGTVDAGTDGGLLLGSNDGYVSAYCNENANDGFNGEYGEPTDCVGDGSSSDIIVLEEEDMQGDDTDTTMSNLDFDTYWATVTDNYPVLQWETE